MCDDEITYYYDGDLIHTDSLIFFSFDDIVRLQTAK